MRLTLDGTRSLLRRLGNPEKGFRSILVGGTNGKGSTCSFISSVLHSSGYTVGLYTSPHLVDFRERIRVSGGCIPREHALELLGTVVPMGERWGHSFFETLTAAAFKYFGDLKVPLVVSEVGLGGRLDSTNVLSPLVSVVTGVSVEHSHILGRTLPTIATEKAGIMRRGRPTVTAARGVALEALDVEAERIGAKLLKVGRDLRLEEILVSRAGSVFSAGLAPGPASGKTGGAARTGAASRPGTADDYFVALRGRFQVRNAGCAILTASCLGDLGLLVKDSAVKRGLEKAQWPGRLDEWGWKPALLFDVAHNPEAAANLSEALSTLYVDREVVAVIGMVQDKDHAGFLRRLLPRVRHTVFTQASCDRALPAGRLKDRVPKGIEMREAKSVKRTVGDGRPRAGGRGRVRTWSIAPSVAEAVDAAISIAGNDELVCVTGSFYTVGEAMNCLGIGVKESI
jgi:dihydrofolate synthase/folylpolyglutamate synthase